MDKDNKETSLKKTICVCQTRLIPLLTLSAPLILSKSTGSFQAPAAQVREKCVAEPSQIQRVHWKAGKGHQQVATTF